MTSVMDAVKNTVLMIKGKGCGDAGMADRAQQGEG
jgi:hypothetical protein